MIAINMLRVDTIFNIAIQRLAGNKFLVSDCQKKFPFNLSQRYQA